MLKNSYRNFRGAVPVLNSEVDMMSVVQET